MSPLTSKAVRRWGAAFLSLMVFWAALVGALDPLELVVGLGTAAAALLVAAGVRARGGFPTLVFRRRTWSRGVHGLARIGPDLALLVHGFRGRGSVSTVHLPSGTDWRHRAERGLAELFGSLAPNRVVIDVTADGEEQAHQQVRRRRR